MNTDEPKTNKQSRYDTKGVFNPKTITIVAPLSHLCPRLVEIKTSIVDFSFFINGSFVHIIT